MRTSSCKAKGRRASQEVKDLLLRYSDLEEADIIVTPSGVTGPDLLLSPLAQGYFPFAIEAKNQEKISIWQAIDQAKGHLKKDHEIPLLFFKRNRSELMVCLRAEDFIRNWSRFK